MRLLHTSDWHLGQKFVSQNREAEHRHALNWLIDTIVREKVDVLLVAGDIFDINNPPVSAEAIYYDFLTALIPTCCRHVVIIGGNHDLPSRLNAPGGLLRALNVHVVGHATDEIRDEIIELRSKTGQIEAIVAAVPFLRDRDFKISIAGENAKERISRIKQGIYEHYQTLGQLVTERVSGLEPRPPLIATGHLYAKGASSSGEQNNIYIGNLENIAAEQFPQIFDYVALGHIHRPQRVGKQERIRYCGSLIPLSFSEIADRKLVLIADFEAGKGLRSVHELEMPIFRKLLSIRGTLSAVEAKLMQAHDPAAILPAWVEIVVESDTYVPGLDSQLREKAKNLNLELIMVKNEQKLQISLAQETNEMLENLNPEDVFRKKIEAMPEIEQAELLDTFRELREWVASQ